ncbi:MAG: asparagine synthase (glutamine-hydrolyzing) [Bdellovibrionota bacterium]
MCGIAGFWNPQKKQSQKSVIENMAKELHHRGPDGSGYHIDPSQGLHMGHTRLSIVDLNSGDQPISDQKAKLTITANGEFYDYKKTRGLLKTQGFDFVTKSDSEIALKLYQKYGLNFVDHLRGEFAFALFDEKKKRLVLVRDRFGIRPLFYHIQNDAVFYASEIKALFQHPDVPQDICKMAQLHQMIQVTLPGQTLYKNIHALKPGHMLVITDKDGHLKVDEKAILGCRLPPQGQHQNASDEELIEQVREKLVESVSFRLEADVPVACYLSGGIDSCSILGMAASIQQSPVKAFTIAFDDHRYDESSMASQMAKMVGADQDILKISTNKLYGENFEKAVWHSERTFYNTLGVAKMLMSEHVHKQGIKVVITGEGSDEIFGGYAAFKQDMFLHDPKYLDPKYQRKLKQNNRIFSGSIFS